MSWWCLRLIVKSIANVGVGVKYCQTIFWLCGSEIFIFSCDWYWFQRIEVLHEHDAAPDFE